jgi:hypothetical protein
MTAAMTAVLAFQRPHVGVRRIFNKEDQSTPFSSSKAVVLFSRQKEVLVGREYVHGLSGSTASSAKW